MRLDGVTLIVSPAEAEAIRAVVNGPLPVIDPFGPNQVLALREMMGEPLFDAVRDAARLGNIIAPDLFGVRVKIETERIRPHPNGPFAQPPDDPAIPEFDEKGIGPR